MQQSLALLSSDFERLVAEYNKLLGEAEHSVPAAADTTERERAERSFRQRLEVFPAAIYTTDAAGRITFYNEAAVKLSGRRALLGTDQWCVTWRLYWPDGGPLPHDECPMAIALKEDRAIRGAQAVAERPDGTRVPFMPHPTPLRDASGALVGAVNMLLDISAPEHAVLDGVQVLVVAPDGFVAAELDLLIDDAGGEAVALPQTATDAIMLLRQRRVDAAIVSFPPDSGEAGPLIEVLVRMNIPFVFHEGNDEHVIQMLGDAIRLRRATH